MRASRETAPGTREEADRARHLGANLRRVRNSQGLSLRDVEEKSGRKWIAVVVGSYERGDRGISVPRLYELAEWYGVDVWTLLPGCEDLQKPSAVISLMSHRVDDLERQWSEFKAAVQHGSAHEAEASEQ